MVRIHEECGWKLLDVVFTMSNNKRPGTTTVKVGPKKTEENTYVFIKNE